MKKTPTRFQTRLLPSESVILETRPSPRIVWVWLFTKALPAGLLMAFLALLAWMFINAPAERGAPRPYASTDGIIFVVGCFVAGLLAAQIYNILLGKVCTTRHPVRRRDVDVCSSVNWPAADLYQLG